MKKFIVEIDERIKTNPEAIRASIGLLGTNLCKGMACKEDCKICPYINIKEVSE